MAITDFLFDFISAFGLNVLMFAGPLILVFWSLLRLVEQAIKTSRLLKETKE